MPINDVSSMNKQHAVPQNIMDVEFKIIGDLTLRQFAYLMLFGGFAFIAFSYVGGIFKWPVAIAAILGGLGFAFVPIEDRGMDQWVVNFFKAVYSPTQKIWKKDPVVPSVFMYDSMQMVRQELITLAPTSSRRKLEEYLEAQGREERKVDVLDIPEADFAGKVHEAFQGYVPLEVPLVQEAYNAPAQTETYVAPAVAVVELAPEPSQTQPTTPSPSDDSKPEEKKVETPVVEPSVAAPPVVAVPAPVVVSTPTPQIQNKYNIKPVRKQHVEPELKLVTRRDRDLSGPVLSPDRQAGRKFLNLSSEDAGRIILPIRGERKLKTSEEVTIEVDIKERTDQLNKLIDQIKQEEGIKEIKKKVEAVPSFAESAVPGQTPIQLPDKEDIDIEANKVIESVKEQNTALTKEIESLKSKGSADNYNQAQLQQLQVAKAKSDEEYSTLLKQLKDLQDKLKEKEQISPNTSSTATSTAVVATSMLTPTKPNVVTGIVKNTQGLALEGIVLLVKNAKGEAVRALKTNTVGQFSLVSPLANGMYTVEVGPYNKVGLTFDIISIEAKGDLISPIEFVGR